MTEDTVYDHSWYEVDDGEYPERTKDGVICEEEIDETCSAGATCAGGVAQVSKPFQRKKGKKGCHFQEKFSKKYLQNELRFAIIIRHGNFP
mgnify:CR=1 FL=1